MLTVERYPLKHGAQVDLPRRIQGAELRHFGIHHGIPSVWIESASHTPLVPHLVKRYETGDPVPDRDHEGDRVWYLGTLQESGGMVWHYYAMVRA